MTRKTPIRAVTIAAAVALLALFASACGGDNNGETTATTGGQTTAAGGPGDVTGTLSEYKIALDKTSAPAGKVTFTVTNAGKITHEFVVIKTNKAPGDLPMEGPEASEKGAVGEIEPDELAPGKTATKSFNLKPGKYVIICNIPGHYMKGQYIGFTVT